MAKFKVNDLIKDNKNMPNNAVIIGKILSISNDTYMIEIVRDTHFPNNVGRHNMININVIDTACSLVEPPKPIISDCLCSSWLLLHKNCICGYAKAKASKFGLEHAA